MNTRTCDSRADGPVVVGTDGSAGAERALVWAAQEAALRRQPLRIVHATDVDAMAGRLSDDTFRLVLESAQSLVDEASKLTSNRVTGLQVTTEVSRKPAAMSLLRAAGEAGTIIVGSRGLGGFSSLLLGSVGLRVAGHANGPVVVVRGTERPEAGVVVVGVRDEDDLDAVRFAGETARRRKASLRLLSAWSFVQYLESMTPVPDAVRAAAEAEAAASSGMLGSIRAEFPDLPVTESVVRVPSPAGELVAASFQADLLVVGTRRPTHAMGAALGRVTHAVLHHAHCPVAVIPRR
ncbi:universal stress protein [Streptomyces sp. NPDC048506]|uniref:universal stress protein n=1 Tax=Streptomyces sp. NPDC048506 TaxID=3155028 RepID=UPI003421D03B